MSCDKKVDIIIVVLDTALAIMKGCKKLRNLIRKKTSKLL